MFADAVIIRPTVFVPADDKPCLQLELYGCLCEICFVFIQRQEHRSGEQEGASAHYGEGREGDQTCSLQNISLNRITFIDEFSRHLLICFGIFEGQK